MSVSFFSGDAPVPLRGAATTSALLEDTDGVSVYSSAGYSVLARILELARGQFRYVALTSSHPERYGVCDSMGFERGLADVDRVTLLREPS